MSGVEADIVREYFEGNGFLVRASRHYPVYTSKRSGEEETELFVCNPRHETGGREPKFFLFTSELPLVEKARVTVMGGCSHFTPGILTSSARFFRFLEKNVTRRAGAPPADGDEADETWRRILVLPGLPTKEPFRTQSIELLRSRGIDGILSFRSMLLELVEGIEINRNYQTSVVRETIRLLKNYDLIKDSQMELFQRAPE